jgi:carbon storage regulator
VQALLVLSRKKNEIVNIGDDISVMIVEIRGDKVRLGIEAPHETPIHRSEVYDAIKNGAPDDFNPSMESP